MDEKIFIVDLTVNAYGGEAMGRLPDGRAVFVPYAVAGETVRVRIVEEKPRFARAELMEVITPAPGRIKPVCGHFGKCGGCHYQMLPYETQLEMKTGIVREQLERLAGLKSVPVDKVVASPDRLNYRNHIQFHLDGAGRPGYHRHHSNEVVAIQECHLWVPEIGEIWPGMDFGDGLEGQRVGLRMGSLGDMQMILESDEPAAPELLVEDQPLSVVHLGPGGQIVLAGSPDVWMEVLERKFRVSAGSFFQVNLAMAGKMVEHVMESFRDLESGEILDLYCGVGLFSAFLAPMAGRLVAIESSPSACEDFVENLDEFDNVELYEAPVEDVLDQIDVKPDVVIADPPRSGLGRKVIDHLVKLNPRRLVYVSCDPATMARDAKALLAGGYVLGDLSFFDMFPQTSHIETVTTWVIR